VLPYHSLPAVPVYNGVLYRHLLDKILAYWASLERHMVVQIKLSLQPQQVLLFEFKVSSMAMSPSGSNQPELSATTSPLTDLVEMTTALGLQLDIKDREQECQIYLPLQMPDFMQDSNKPAMSDTTPTPAKRFTILIADDNPINLTVLKQVMSKWSVTTVLVDNGALAVEAMEAQHIDLVLMDLHMPEMDGFEASTRIRAMEDVTKRQVPIIAFTGDEQHDVQEQMTSVGITDFLSKPYRLPDLEEKVLTYLPGAKSA